jgi:hypothetical protein
MEQNSKYEAWLGILNDKIQSGKTIFRFRTKTIKGVTTCNADEYLAAYNTGLAKVAVLCFVGQFCGYINFSASLKV